MPTIKPRINLTVSQDTYDLLTELAVLQGASRASIVNDLLEASLPALERALTGLSALHERQRLLEQEAADLARMDRDQMMLRIDDAERMLAPLLAESLGVFDKLVEDSKRPTQPPHSNTGVTPPPSNPPSGGRKHEKAKGNKHLGKRTHGGQGNARNGGQKS